MKNFVFAGPPDGGAVATTPTATPGAAGGLFQLVFLLLIFFVMMYFLVILPQKRREKQFKQMISSIKRGDTVITSGGVVGKVLDVKKDTLKIKTANTTELEIAKAYVSRVIKEKTETQNSK
ncbi:preprotein translocase subunit YajC [Thermosipho ferrireducens]|uniref:Preprotein translocase subunit YajC n=1 Tax=Thermosipho ferrireducens TaxID=2571116 RepID=A0ABX7S5W8_9BACT|nr:preprotein translocase subunit YajC [Thermosipho ferrireducens]QTA37957.1 preprotein translocase subunit YajC [Thermosipho ferrireducens]